MKWNISVIERKKTNKYYGSTGEGICKRSSFIKNNSIKVKKDIEFITREGISPVFNFYNLIRALSKMLYVN